MLLLLFGTPGAAPTPAAGGHPGKASPGSRAWRGQLANDDDMALQMLLDAEDDDVRSALDAYGNVLRRLLT